MGGLLDEENRGGEIMVDRGRTEIKEERTGIRWQKWRSRGGALSAVFLVKVEREMDKWVVKEGDISHCPG